MESDGDVHLNFTDAEGGPVPIPSSAVSQSALDDSPSHHHHHPHMSDTSFAHVDSMESLRRRWHWLQLIYSVENLSALDRGFIFLGSYDTISRQPIRKLTPSLTFRYLLWTLLFWALRTAADYASSSLVIGPHVSPCFLSAGANLLCSLVLGPIWAIPMLIFIEFSSAYYTFPVDMPSYYLPSFNILKELVYVIEAYVLLFKFRIDFRFRTARSLFYFTATTVVSHACIAFIFIGMNTAAGRIAPDHIFEFVMAWALGDLVGILNLAVVFLIVLPHVANFIPRVYDEVRALSVGSLLRTVVKIFWDFVVLIWADLAAIVACLLIIMYVRPHPLYLAFFSILWSVIRHGVLGIPVFVVLSVLLIVFPQIDELNTALDFQMLLLAMAYCALLVGMTLDQKDHFQRRLNERTEQLLDEQRRMNVLQQRLLANVSHEIRTPLYGILGMLELCLIECKFQPTVAEKLQCALNAGRVLMHLLNDIIDYRKLVEGKLKITPKPFDALQLVESVVALFQQHFSQKGLTCELVVEDDPVTGEPLPKWLLGDEMRLAQILTNLITNAMKFTEEGGVLTTVRYEGRQGLLRISVKDSGIGIDPNNLETIFDKFSQVDNSSTRAFHGAGLGLTVVKELLALMGGTVQVQSEKGKGSVFSISVPCATTDVTAENTPKHHLVASRPNVVVCPTQPAAAASPSDSNPQIEAENSDTDLHLPRVLVVEDNELIARITTQLLKDHCRCDVAGNGKIAIDYVAQKAFSLILMDMHMPIVDGLEATATIRKMVDNPNHSIPILGLTASCFEEDVNRCLASGMDEVLNKPVSRRLLIDHVIKAIRRYESSMVPIQESSSVTPSGRKARTSAASVSSSSASSSNLTSPSHVGSFERPSARAESVNVAVAISPPPQISISNGTGSRRVSFSSHPPMQHQPLTPSDHRRNLTIPSPSASSPPTTTKSSSGSSSEMMLASRKKLDLNSADRPSPPPFVFSDTAL